MAEYVKELLERASQTLVGTEAGWHGSEVSKLHVLLKVLSKLFSDPLGLDEAEARREYQVEMRMSGQTEQDQDALTFISEAANGFAGFATDPHTATVPSSSLRLVFFGLLFQLALPGTCFSVA
jgi:hypothetical protein